MSNLSRKKVLAALGAVAASGPYLFTARVEAANESLEPYQRASIDWQQAKGETITVAFIPAGYFNNFIALTPQFQQLTGINVQYQKIPPLEIRAKAVLDFTSKTGNFDTHAGDPAYFPLFVANKWIEPLDEYLHNPKYTDAKWYDFNDIFTMWHKAVNLDGKQWGLPSDGETTFQIYRTDLYKQKGIKPAATLEEYTHNAQVLNDPSNHVYGCALRGFRGAGQNVYIWSSIFLEYGGTWFKGNQPYVNSPAAVEALEWYVSLLNKYAPPGVQNWNWPDIADAFSQGAFGSYIDSNTSAMVAVDPAKSKIVGKVGAARWPAGPTGKRAASLWAWELPINASISPRKKLATWLYIQWATCRETQVRTSYAFNGTYKRLGVNRYSVLRSSGFRSLAAAVDNWLPVTLETLAHDIPADYHPPIPQWPPFGEALATAVQQALVGQAKPKDALDNAQREIAGIMQKRA
jgi:multiple sugar transport system substrate-binding protein